MSSLLAHFQYLLDYFFDLLVEFKLIELLDVIYSLLAELIPLLVVRTGVHASIFGLLPRVVGLDDFNHHGVAEGLAIFREFALFRFH